MKTAFLFCLYLSSFSPLVAQHWQPLPLNDRLSFRHSDSVLIAQELMAVNLQLLPNGDSAWQLNKIAIVCDTCPGMSFLRNQGQMLQVQMVLRDNGDIHFQGRNSYLLKHGAPMGTSWLFDTLNNWTATVVEISAGTVLGQPDSLKTIALSNGKQILLSRQFGLVSWPDLDASGTFDLVGIKTRALGLWSPDWRDFYDFSVGDVFQHIGDYTYEIGTAIVSSTYSKATILEKWTEGDTLCYRTDIWSRVHYVGPFVDFRHDTIIQKFHPALVTPWSESWPKQLWFMPELHSSIGSDSVFAVCHLSFSPLFGISKVVGDGEKSMVDPTNCDIISPTFQGGPDDMTCDNCIAFTDQISVGLGMTYHHYGCFEYFETDILSAFVKNGDTTGVLYPDSFFTSATLEPFHRWEMKVAPNPTSSVWQLNFAVLTEPLHVLLSDIHGKVLQHFTFPQGVSRGELSGNALPNGVYFLKMSDGLHQATWRLMKL